MTKINVPYHGIKIASYYVSKNKSTTESSFCMLLNIIKIENLIDESRKGDVTISNF